MANEILFDARARGAIVSRVNTAAALRRRSGDVTMDPYMTKTEGLLQAGREMLDGRRARAEKAGAEARAMRIDVHRRLKDLGSRYAGVCRLFDQLRAPGAKGVADLKVALERAWGAFESEMGRSR
jgi:hypothetical protein